MTFILDFPTKLHIPNDNTLQRNKIAPTLPKLTVNRSPRIHGPAMSRTKFQSIRVYPFPRRCLQDGVPSTRFFPNWNQDLLGEARNPKIIRGVTSLGCSTGRLHVRTPAGATCLGCRGIIVHEHKAGSFRSKCKYDSDNGNIRRL